MVRAPDGPTLVLAGAGSGKTRTVTHRVAHLMSSGVAPERILLLTFTNKAAREMLERVEALVAVDRSRLWGGTFHRIGNLALRRHAERLGFEPDFSILDREDAEGLLAMAVGDLALTSANRLPKPRVLLASLSFAVNTQRELGSVLRERWPVLAHLEADVAAVAARYAERKREVNAMDFDDLLAHFVTLLRDHAHLREHYAERFQHVLVDEYQDTNRLQGEMIDLLASRHRNVMVVGDDAQSIYSFRGAEYQNILEFNTRYPDARLLKLERSYRSTPEILQLANASIAVNRRRHEKHLVPSRSGGALPVVAVADSAQEQAAFVAARVADLRDEGRALDEIAVLYRSHWHSLELQMELTKASIPCEIRSGARFFDSAHVKDVLSYLRIVQNPRDQLAWRRVLMRLPRVGARTADKVFAGLVASADPLAVAATGLLRLLPKAARGAAVEMEKLFGRLAEPHLRHRPQELLHEVTSSEYAHYLHDSYEDAVSRLEDLSQLQSFASGFDSLEGFLTDLTLATSGDDEAAAERDPAASLVLSTIHQAKGLEWGVVFVVWLAEGRFPSSRSLETDGGEEEERRLFYVAVTRARDQVYLCYPRFGRDGERQSTLLRTSRFLLELPRDTYETWRVGGEGTPEITTGELTRDSSYFDDGPFYDDLGG